MRHAIDTAPRDGQAVIVENDSTGSYDVAHWSDQVGQWVAENGEPSKVTPTHWHPIPKYFQQEHDKSSTSSQRRRSSSRSWRLVTACAVALIAAALIRVYLGFERETLLPGEESRKTELLALRQQPEADQATARAGTQKAVQARQAMEASVPQRRQSWRMNHPEKFWRMSHPRPNGPSRGSMCSCRRKPRTAHDRSNRSGRIWPLPRRRPRLRDKS